jgi:hypothetical protein
MQVKNQKGTLFWIHVYIILLKIRKSYCVIFKKKGGYILEITTKLYVTCNDDTASFCYKIGCDDEEEVDSDPTIYR